MKRLFYTIFGLVIIWIGVSISLGALYNIQLADAQSITPAPWLSIAAPFRFCYTYPDQLGCADAEDKTGDPYVKGWKHDVDRARADCLRWAAVGTLPAAQLSLDPLCSGGTRLIGGIYWFDAPIIIGTPTPPPSAATFTPFPSPPAGGTPTPFPTSGTPTPTRTPGAPAGNIPTLSPAQRQAFGTYCDRSGRGYGMIIFGSYGLTYNVPDEWCAPVRDASEELLRRMREATPTWVEIRP